MEKMEETILLLNGRMHYLSDNGCIRLINMHDIDGMQKKSQRCEEILSEINRVTTAYNEDRKLNEIKKSLYCCDINKLSRIILALVVNCKNKELLQSVISEIRETFKETHSKILECCQGEIKLQEETVLSKQLKKYE